MADKRRYFERDSREKEAANSASISESSRHSSKDDDPPNSRLFILCGRNVSEDELRGAFEKFGTIKELWIVKDKASGDSKGVAYIKYAKTSEAAVAMEEMNGKFIGNNAKSLKVLIANSRDQGSRREMNEEERLLRLFIIVPKSMSESELKEHFAQFGDVEHCNVVRDRNTKESKGYAYVKFHRISHAAKAYEGCDRSFKPVFADPRPQKQLVDDRYSSAHGSTGPYDLHEYSPMEQPFQPMLNHHHPHSHLNMDSQLPLSLAGGSGSTMGHSNRLTVIAHGSLNQDQLWRLCDFFPGLDYCNVRHDSKTRQCYATVVYNSAQAAAYAKEKLHGFEYPPGHRLIVKLDTTTNDTSHLGHHHVHPIHSRTGLLGPAGGGPTGGATLSPSGQSSTSRYSVPAQSTLTHNGSAARNTNSAIPQDLATLAETIAQATSIIQAAGLTASHHISHAQHPHGEYDPSYCSVKLPGPQPLAPIDSTVMERLFVVCHPAPPPIYALKDTFGRFGNLIDIFMLNGKNFGYAKYASKSSADEARNYTRIEEIIRMDQCNESNTLHGQEVCGMRLKVFPAEPQDQKSLTAGNASGGNVNQSGTPKGTPTTSGIGIDQQCKRIKIDNDDDDEEVGLLD